MVTFWSSSDSAGVGWGSLEVATAEEGDSLELWWLHRIWRGAGIEPVLLAP